MKILYIYSNKDEVDILRKLFKKKCAILDLEEDNNKAIEKAIMNRYDVIMIDIFSKKRSIIGIDLCKRLRNENVISPIISIAEKSHYKNLLLSMKAGSDDFMIKPFNFEELYLRAQAMLRRPIEYVNNAIEMGDFILDIQNKRLYYKEFFIKLTKKEISLVEFFMRNQNTVLTRDEILENVWDINANPLSNIVEVYIRNTRLKIKNASNVNFINNIQGIGYYVGNIEKIKKDNFNDN